MPAMVMRHSTITRQNQKNTLTHLSPQVSLSSGRDRMMDHEASLTLTVGLILVTYLVCNVPANLILLLDPGSVSAANQSSVLFNLTNHRAGLYTSLHLPCYLLAWLSSIVKAACYIACTANFRQSLREIMRKWRAERV